MAIKTGLAAAALLLLTISGASACDDFDDEMATVAALQATKPAQPAASQPAPAQQAAAAVPSQPEPTSVAAVEPKSAQPPTTASLASSVRR